MWRNTLPSSVNLLHFVSFTLRHQFWFVVRPSVSSSTSTVLWWLSGSVPLHGAGEAGFKPWSVPSSSPDPLSPIASKRTLLFCCWLMKHMVLSLLCSMPSTWLLCPLRRSVSWSGRTMVVRFRWTGWTIRPAWPTQNPPPAPQSWSSQAWQGTANNPMCSMPSARPPAVATGQWWWSSRVRVLKSQEGNVNTWRNLSRITNRKVWAKVSMTPLWQMQFDLWSCFLSQVCGVQQQGGCRGRAAGEFNDYLLNYGCFPSCHFNRPGEVASR